MSMSALVVIATAAVSSHCGGGRTGGAGAEAPDRPPADVQQTEDRPEVALAITGDAVSVAGEVVVELDGGDVPWEAHRGEWEIPVLVQAMEPLEHEADEALELLVDGSVPYDTLALVLHSAGTTGPGSFSMFIEQADGGGVISGPTPLVLPHHGHTHAVSCVPIPKGLNVEDAGDVDVKGPDGVVVQQDEPESMGSAGDGGSHGCEKPLLVPVDLTVLVSEEGFTVKVMGELVGPGVEWLECIFGHRDCSGEQWMEHWTPTVARTGDGRDVEELSALIGEIVRRLREEQDREPGSLFLGAEQDVPCAVLGELLAALEEEEDARWISGVVLVLAW
jgi:hypothetical protein